MESNQVNRGQWPETHRRPRILIADNALSSRELLHSILDSCGYEIVEVVDCFDVLECAIAFKPHLVILDLQMPRLDGCTAANLLRGHPSFEGIPMIALTAAVSEVSADRVAAAGFTTHLVKPIGPDRLRRCVASLL